MTIFANILAGKNFVLFGVNGSYDISIISSCITTILFLKTLSGLLTQTKQDKENHRIQIIDGTNNVKIKGQRSWCKVKVS